jgi:hypothetical protein
MSLSKKMGQGTSNDLGGVFFSSRVGGDRWGSSRSRGTWNCNGHSIPTLCFFALRAPKKQWPHPTLNLKEWLTRLVGNGGVNLDIVLAIAVLSRKRLLYNSLRGRNLQLQENAGFVQRACFLDVAIILQALKRCAMHAKKDSAKYQTRPTLGFSCYSLKIESVIKGST